MDEQLQRQALQLVDTALKANGTERLVLIEEALALYRKARGAPVLLEPPPSVASA